MGSRKIKSVLPLSALLGERWQLPDAPSLQLLRPTYQQLRVVDALWPQLRPPDSQHRDWRWAGLAGTSRERFGLFDGERCVALWCSTATRLLRLELGECYRLDFLEVAPDAITTRLGRLTFGLAAVRAAEVGAEGLVLQSLPQAEHFYARLGGDAGRIADWNETPDMVTFHFRAETLYERAADAYAFHVDG